MFIARSHDTAYDAALVEAIAAECEDRLHQAWDDGRTVALPAIADDELPY